MGRVSDGDVVLTCFSQLLQTGQKTKPVQTEFSIDLGADKNGQNSTRSIHDCTKFLQEHVRLIRMNFL